MRCMIMKRWLPVVMLVLWASAGSAQEPLRLRCQWSRPATGTPPVAYELQIMDIDGGLDTTITVAAQPTEIQQHEVSGVDYARRYQARVRGLGGQGAPGPWSDWSVVYSFEVEDPEP